MGDSRSKQIASLADLMGFALWQVNHPEFRIEELLEKMEGEMVEEESEK